MGGFLFGMGAQIVILPYLDSIAEFTVLFVAISAVGAWFATSSPRLAYFGVQIIVAFYLINLQEFKEQISLGVARDRVVGILLCCDRQTVFFFQSPRLDAGDSDLWHLCRGLPGASIRWHCHGAFWRHARTQTYVHLERFADGHSYSPNRMFTHLSFGRTCSSPSPARSADYAGNRNRWRGSRGWVFVAEHARRHRVGIAIGLLTSGLSFGILLGSLVALALNVKFSQAEIKNGYWRIPFVIGGVFGFLAMFLRQWLGETPVFEEMRMRAAASRELPLRVTLRNHRRAVVTSAISTWVHSSHRSRDFNDASAATENLRTGAS